LNNFKIRIEERMEKEKKSRGIKSWPADDRPRENSSKRDDREVVSSQMIYNWNAVSLQLCYF